MKTRAVAAGSGEAQRADALLRNRKTRSREGVFLVQGVRPLDMALDHGFELRRAYVALDPPRPRSTWAEGVLAQADDVLALPAATYAELAQRDDGLEVVGEVAIPDDDLDRLPRPLGPGPLLVLDRVASPGNLGSAIRSADALGACGVVVLGHAADPYDPACVRATTGSLFALPVVRVGSPAALGTWLPSGTRVLGADEEGTTDLDAGDLTDPVALLLGSEARGMGAGARALCTATVAIPMAERRAASSLNVAAAATVLLHEAARARRRSPS